MSQHHALYYLGDQNMIEESVRSASYSMRFENESVSQSKSMHPQNSKKPVATTTFNQAKATINEVKYDGEGTPVFLGEQVYNRIRDRYTQLKKLESNDPDVLYDFYMAHRKLHTEDKNKQTKEMTQALMKTEKAKPEAMRKMMSKIEFGNILSYNPRDVYYTLLHQAKKVSKDKQLQNDLKKKNEELARAQQQQRNRKSVDLESMITRLYGKENKSEQETPEQKLRKQNMKFGAKLTQVYRDRRPMQNKYSVKSLYDFWQELEDKDELGLRISSKEVQGKIKYYYNQQVINLVNAHKKKLGFQCQQAKALLKFMKSLNVEALDTFEVYIPEAGFKEYVQQYNKVKQAQAKQKQQNEKKAREKQEEQRRKSVAGRPASATPLTILSQPKNLHSQALQLAKQFPNDKALKQLLMSKVVPQARYPEQYGRYDRGEQIKIKNWVKPKPGVNPERQIQNILLKTTFQACSNKQQQTKCLQLLEEQDAQLDKNWKYIGPALKDALQTHAYNHKYMRDLLIRFCSDHFYEEYKDLDTNTIVDKLIKTLTGANQSDRRSHLSQLSHVINREQMQLRQSMMTTQQQDQQKQARRQENRFRSFLVAKAKEYIKKKQDQFNGTMTSVNPNKDTKMQYLKQLFEQAKSKHPDYVNKNFPVIEQSLPYSPLFKYEFFKTVKNINPQNMTKDSKPKSYVWAAGGSTNSFNRVMKDFSKDRNVLKADKPDKRDTVWNRDNMEERLKILCKFDEAKECTFKPIVHKMK